MPYTIEAPAESKSKYTIEEPAVTTAGGVAAAVTRGVAPYAAGAAVGAAAGAPFFGVGAVPGALLGAGAVGLTETATSLYDRAADYMGLPKVPTPRDATDAALDAVGIKRPSTGTERVIESASGGAAGALGGAGAARAIADKATGPVVKRVAEQLADKPVLQTVSGASGGAAGQVAAEAGAGTLGQVTASLLGGAVPFAPAAAARSVATEPRAAAVTARQAGYVLPPSAISDKPGVVSSVLAGWSGKIKTQQAASAHNQEITNRLAAESLGLPAGTVISDQVLHDIRDQAGKAYQAVKTAVPTIYTDAAFDGAVAGLGGSNSQAAQFFPKITNNPGVKDLVDELLSVKQFPTEAGVEIVKELRFNANSNLKAIGDPSKHALGLAQRQAADLVDELMDRTITAAGQPDAIANYRAARQLIAKSYDVEAVLNSATGDVNAKGLARLSAKGRPLTGELDTIAKTAEAFPKDMQAPAGFGHNEDLSALDFFGAAASMVHGRPSVAGAIVGRPIARRVILSEPYQNRATTPPGLPIPPLSVLSDPGFGSIVPPPADTFGR